MAGRGGRREGAGRRPGKSGPTAKTRALRRRIRKHQDLTADATIEQIRRGCQFDIRTLFDAKGNLRPIHELTAEEAMPIAGFEVLKRNVTSGDDKIDTVLKVKLIDRSRYVEMAAKHHGILRERLELSGKVTLEDLVAGSMKSPSSHS